MLHLLQYQGFRCQALSPIQVPLGRPGFGTHHEYHLLNEPFPDVLVCLTTLRARLIPWFVLLFSVNAWVTLIEHSFHSAREKGSGVMAGGGVTVRSNLFRNLW